jgi:BNR repeat protein
LSRRPARWFGRAGAAIALGAVLALTPSARASVTLLQLSSDPYTNTTSQHATEVEPDTLSHGSTIVSAFQVGRFFGGGASNIGFAASVNGGASFTHGFLPGTTPYATPAGTYAAVSDASVAFDAKHGVWLISYLGLAPGGTASAVDVLVSRSTDNGQTWSNPVVVRADGHFNDKNWTVCDNTSTSPFFGHCYTEFDDNSKTDLIQMTTSSDGGATWSAPVPTHNHAHGIGGQPLVQPSGRVVVPIEGFAGRSGAILSYVSTNGGASWSNVVIVALVAHHPIAGNLRAGILPSAEITASGKVYVIWSDCRFEPNCTANDLVFSSSTDGVNWSDITQIPADAVGAGIDHFVPGLAVHGAKLVVAFYYYPTANCTASTCQLDVGYASSADAGADWSTTTHLAGPMSLPWLANTSQGYMVGDYISSSFTDTTAFPAFALANAPSGSTFDEATFTVAGGLSASGTTPATLHVSSHPTARLTGSTLTLQ